MILNLSWDFRFPLPTLQLLWLSCHWAGLIFGTSCAFQEKKISRNELIHKVRQIAGDKLLISVIKSFRAKVYTILMNWIIRLTLLLDDAEYKMNEMFC